MRILLVYGTNSGGTQDVSNRIAAVLRQAGHQVRVARASIPAIPSFSRYDLVLLGSCSWLRQEGSQALEGQLQEHMYAFTKRLETQQFVDRPFAIFALGDSSYTHFCGAADHLEDFVKRVGGRLLLPPLRIDGYYFALDENRRRADRWGLDVARAITRRKKR